MDIKNDRLPPFSPPESKKPEKEIRIINGKYDLLFTVQDGDYILVADRKYQINYIDETHFKIDGSYYHICEFGEKIVDKGIPVEPYENNE